MIYEYKDDISKCIHTHAQAVYAAGGMTKDEMRQFDYECLIMDVEHPDAVRCEMEEAEVHCEREVCLA